MHAVELNYITQKLRFVAMMNCTIKMEAICAVANKSMTRNSTNVAVVMVDLALPLLVHHAAMPLSYPENNIRRPPVFFIWNSI
jgi:hypothetical protein